MQEIKNLHYLSKLREDRLSVWSKGKSSKRCESEKQAGKDLHNSSKLRDDRLDTKNPEGNKS